MKMEIGGVRFDERTKEEVLADIESRLDGKRPTRVFTPNPLMVQNAKRDARLRAALSHADVNLCDGIGILLAARLLGTPLPERITGIDFAEELVALAEQQGLRLFLLGGKPGVADAAAKALWRRYPRLNICGACHGYFDEEDGAYLAAHIAAKRPDILFVCLGSPRQEIFIDEHMARTGATLGIGLGGTLDVWAGNVRRAPKFFRNIGLEWLWRMAREPRRLAGIPHMVVFLVSAFLERFKKSVKMHSSR